MTVLDLTTALVAAGLFSAGFFLLLQRSLTRMLLGFLVLGHATNLLLLAAAGPPGSPPITGEVRAGDEPNADPLPQAMALTAIVITFALTIFLLALVHRSWQLHGTDEVRDDAEDRRLEENQQREHDAAHAANAAEAAAAAADADLEGPPDDGGPAPPDDPSPFSGSAGQGTQSDTGSQGRSDEGKGNGQ